MMRTFKGVRWDEMMPESFCSKDSQKEQFGFRRKVLFFFFSCSCLSLLKVDDDQGSAVVRLARLQWLDEPTVEIVTADGAGYAGDHGRRSVIRSKRQSGLGPWSGV